MELKKGQWTDWQYLTFKITPLVRIHGMAQFFLVEDQPEVKLYMSPINWDPRNPPRRTLHPMTGQRPGEGSRNVPHSRLAEATLAAERRAHR